jgi:hypothetical protein
MLWYVRGLVDQGIRKIRRRVPTSAQTNLCSIERTPTQISTSKTRTGRVTELLYADILDQKSGYARDQARDDFRNRMLVAICKSYLRIQRNGVVQYVSKLTSEAQDHLEPIEELAGERAPRAVVLPPPPPKSAQELLTEEVLRDWKFLPVDKVRHKMNNHAYKAEFDRLTPA